LTLRQWVRRLEARHEEAVRLTDEVTYRVWRLYMAACAYCFRTGSLNLYQALLAKPAGDDSRLPLTRRIGILIRHSRHAGKSDQGGFSL
jgi:cyclopropane-fatty-acyl-phospholipid synthase